MPASAPADLAARVILIAPHSSYRLVPYMRAAQALGVRPLVVSRGEHSLVSAVAQGVQVDFDDMPGARAKILHALGAEPAAAVIGTDDATVELAARVAEALGLAHNAPQAALLSRRKDLARACLARVTWDAGGGVPAFRRLDRRVPLEAQIVDLEYPCVLKPVALSGSRGVIRVDSAQALLAAAARIGAIVDGEYGAGAARLEEARYLLLERYVPGEELALEGILRDGELRVLALFDKPDPLEGPYFEESYYITPSRHRPEVQAAVRETVVRACAAYGLREGPVHAELRVNAGGAWVMEVAARTIGGQCARLLNYASGRALEELVIANAMGLAPPTTHDGQAAGVLMIPIPRAGILRRVEGLLAARRVEYIEDIEISQREGYALSPLPEGASYLGFMFARAPRADLAEAALREAHAKLNIVTAPLLPVI